MKFKVMTYNILHGFYSYGLPFIHQKEREAAAVKIVKDANPDILILTEACFSKANFYSKQRFGISQDYAKIFGYAYEAYGIRDNEWGMCVLSKYPFSSFEDYSSRDGTFVRIKIKLGKKVLDLDAVHASHSSNEWDRRRFFKNILRDVGKPYIIAGDFNALSREDDYSRDKLLKGFVKVAGDDVERFVNDKLSFMSLNEVLAKKLIDTYKKKNKKFDFTIPTDFLSTDKDSGVRMDYIFCSNDLKVLDSGIIKVEEAEIASDHYPVFAVLNIN